MSIVQKKNPLNKLLHDAFTRRDYETMAELVNAGADINARDINRLGILHWAIVQSDRKCVAFLLKLGADPNLASNEGQTPLHFATYKNEKMVALLLRNKADPNMRIKNGMTALHLALATHQNASARLLIRHGADVYLEDNQGRTPYRLAQQMDNPEGANIVMTKISQDNSRRTKHIHKHSPHRPR